ISTMKDFIKFTFATVVGIIISTVVMFFIMMGIISGIISSATEDKMTEVKPNSIIEMRLDKGITERTSKNPMSNFNFGSMDMDQAIGLDDILKNLEKAKTDENIKGIFLNLSSVPTGVATIEEVREALINFKDSSGKFIIAYGDFMSQGAYYIATAADRIYINPEGLVEFKGLNAEIMFFTKALENLGVTPQIIRGKNNRFKSAVEPFMYTEMSDDNRKQTETYMFSIWNHLLTGISKSRGVSVDELNIYADSMLISSAEKAKEYKLVDDIKYMDEVIAELKSLAGLEDSKDLRLVSIDKYTNSPKKREQGKGLIKEKIAIVYANGQIDMGEGDEEAIGSEGLSEAIREARLDSSIKAIVLRVNSPGGSALASEVIWREVALAKQSKPLIVSMGDYAASGGYYIACPADVIVTNPTTLTGSIGVFGILWNAEELLSDKIGVTFDRVMTNKHSDIGSIYRPMSTEESDIIQIEVDNVYHTFKSHVSEARNMTIEQVDSIGQGRVWSGINALEIGLVDEIGGIRKAIDIAADRAGLDEYRIVTLPEIEDPFEKIIKEMTGQAEISAMKKHLGPTYSYFKMMKQAFCLRGVQARLPYAIEIH
ncbi:MAG: signal peptide peptidase SppA, partial [Bacteroidota bacterium]